MSRKKNQQNVCKLIFMEFDGWVVILIIVKYTLLLKVISKMSTIEGNETQNY